MLKRLHPALLLLLPLLPLAAQQGVTTYRNFHHYPTGQWQQELQGFSEGRPLGPPVTQVNCTSPMDPARAAAIRNLGNQIGVMSACTTHVLRDEERLAESEQICNPGAARQTIHTTLQAIDDKTIKSEVVSTIGSHKTTMLSTVRYLGTCTAAQQAEAAQAAAAMPVTPSLTPALTAEQCGEIRSNQREMAETMKSCDQAPADQRSTCVATLKAATVRLDRMLASCPR